MEQKCRLVVQTFNFLTVGLGCNPWGCVGSRNLSWVLQEGTKYSWSSSVEAGTDCTWLQTSAAEFYGSFSLIPRNGPAPSNQDCNCSAPPILPLPFFFLELQIWREKDVSFRVRGEDREDDKGRQLEKSLRGTWGEIFISPYLNWIIVHWRLAPGETKGPPCDIATSCCKENSEASKAQEQSWVFYPLRRLRGSGGAQAGEKWKPQRAGRRCQSGKGKFICDVN